MMRNARVAVEPHNHKLETEMNIEIDDHKIALLVNAITAELKPFTKWHPKSSAAQSLRARVSGIVLEHLKPKAGTSCGRSANSAMARFEDWEVYNELASWETPPVSFTEPTISLPIVTKDPFPLQTGTKLKTL